MQDDGSAKVLAPNLGASNGSGDWNQASGVANGLTRARPYLELANPPRPPVPPL